MQFKKKINFHKPKIIAEIGCNHKGDLDIAKEMIKQAAEAGADYVKFQKRDNKYLLKDKYNEPHPVKENSYGDTYGEHREYLEFSIKQHKHLYNFCKKNKIGYSTSVWEKNSALEMINSKLNLDFLKVPSACNLDFELLECLAKKFKKKIHVSLGMTTSSEVNKIFNFFKKFKREKDIVFYACTSDYPAKFEDLCLLEISNLKSKYQKKISSIAFSGHHLGIAVDIAAYILGASFIERHFTLDRTWKGTDHAASLETNGLQKLCRDVNNTFKSLKYKNGKILKNEFFQRRKLKLKTNR
jgi:N-acetylneuraminate synthase